MVAIEPRSGSDELGDAVHIVFEPAVDTVRADSGPGAALFVCALVLREDQSLEADGCPRGPRRRVHPRPCHPGHPNEEMSCR